MQTVREQITSSPLDFLREKFLERKKINDRYSIAAYARDLGVSASFLSRLLSGDRPLTVKLVVQMGAVFEQSAEVIDQWISSTISTSSKNAKIPRRVRERFEKNAVNRSKHPIHFYELERFKAISQWYHFAILSLTHVKNFKSDAIWIARRIGISTVESQDAIHRLLELGLLERKNGKLRQTENMLFVDQTKPDLAVSQFHQQMCEKAKAALQDPSDETFQQQYFSGITMAFDRKKVPEFKKKLKAISREMMRPDSDEQCSDLYQFNIQFFPITKSSKGDL